MHSVFDSTNRQKFNAGPAAKILHRKAKADIKSGGFEAIGILADCLVVCGEKMDLV